MNYSIFIIRYYLLYQKENEGDSEVAKDLANHFINHWIEAGIYDVNSLPLGACENEYESFFGPIDNDASATSFYEDLYNC